MQPCASGTLATIWAPRALAEPIAKKLEALAQKAMASKSVAEKLAPQSFEPGTLTGESFGAFIAQQRATYLRIVKDANIVSE